MNKDNLKGYFEGSKLYGDDFSLNEIKKWFKDEKEAYFNNLVAKNIKDYKYNYHALNYEKGFRFLPNKRFSHVLGVGSAYGREFIPISKRVDKFTILEPSEGFVVKEINSKPVNYVKPKMNGEFPFASNSFDLITCFGTLHHISNVNKILKEIYRCLKRNGYALIREPIVSMGDWRTFRKGLTKRERGIPLKFFHNMISLKGFEIIKEQMCIFPLIVRLRHFMNKPVYNSKFAVFLDNILCCLFAWNYNYHPTNLFKKLRPVSIFYVLHKK